MQLDKIQTYVDYALICVQQYVYKTTNFTNMFNNFHLE